MSGAGVVELRGNGDFGDALPLGWFGRSRPQVFRDTRVAREGAPPFGAGGRGEFTQRCRKDTGPMVFYVSVRYREPMISVLAACRTFRKGPV